ncbi:type I-F CRISPR-associated protein Csy3 [Acidithiobacillus sp.]|jgi:CRISPR-associated protein Csy3|uniref:type I-F CRISPR-associated protein Csy3 n=1 Tax=Acidithiobacillus sp. TaxID=1872118 RepID=UPI0025C37BF4|nr:type I-F CRISPR-associated protein Csy3 [Acidithiobacillus sp.]MCK9188999.1 type I-F CRISPR-associated protein Csy3 [Acidithiobacillus sp.]MCK9359340.1 type I-F CRISPR-associated protein Csy3 [Acidithiobacillus sp.]
MEINSNTLPLKNLPSVLAFRRGVVITDAPLEYGNTRGDVVPVPVIHHGTMGTQNVNEKKAKASGNAGTDTVSDAERDVRNLQVIESAKTGPDMMDLQIGFEIKALPLGGALHACANSKKENLEDAEKMRAMLDDFILRAKNSEGLAEVSRRIARNVCNGRWLWRNRLIASGIRVEVSAGDQQWEVPDALQVSLRDFNHYSDIEKSIGEVLASGFRGNAKKVALRVRAILDLGVTGSVEVFCSQNYEPDTGRSSGKGELSRSLYKLAMSTRQQDRDGVRIVGQAAFRDAKIWNALRTMDNWYPGHSDTDMPIPIEPQGASLSMMQFLRAKENKKFSAFELFKRLNQIDPDSAEGMYCIASLMRGGVFGDSEKDRGDEGGGAQ